MNDDTQPEKELDARELVTELVSRQEGIPGALITDYVIVSSLTTFDDDGNVVDAVSVIAEPDIPEYRMAGLLTYAQVLSQSRIAGSSRVGDDDD